MNRQGSAPSLWGKLPLTSRSKCCCLFHCSEVPLNPFNVVKLSDFVVLMFCQYKLLWFVKAKGTNRLHRQNRHNFRELPYLYICISVYL